MKRTALTLTAAGFASLIYGIALISTAGAWIIAGTLLLAVGTRIDL